MIYTVTFNPAIDYVVKTEKIALGSVNRAASEQIYYGGKGINVSAVLAELGIRSKALGFTAGFTGEAIERGVEAMGIDADFVRLKEGTSRINVKIRAEEETELNGQGPHIDDEALSQLFKKLDRLKDGDTLILAGSIPNSLPSNVYERIMEMLSDRDIRT
ncbi:MAG: 1-phosphofructokinase, partial [Ruminococcus sp.]|nr:1-phosphofructokinase [Ruminococcus sp.]